jgi:hypothetical protein
VTLAEGSDSLVDRLAVEERGEEEQRLPGWLLYQKDKQFLFLHNWDSTNLKYQEIKSTLSYCQTNVYLYTLISFFSP